MKNLDRKHLNIAASGEICAKPTDSTTDERRRRGASRSVTCAFTVFFHLPPTHLTVCNTDFFHSISKSGCLVSNLCCTKPPWNHEYQTSFGFEQFLNSKRKCPSNRRIRSFVKGMKSLQSRRNQGAIWIPIINSFRLVNLGLCLFAAFMT